MERGSHDVREVGEGDGDFGVSDFYQGASDEHVCEV